MPETKENEPYGSERVKMKEYLSYSCSKHNNRIVFYNKEFGYVLVEEKSGITECLDTESCAADFAILEIGNEIYAFSNGNVRLEQIDGNKVIDLPKEVSKMYANDYITFGDFWGLLFGNDFFVCKDDKGNAGIIHFEELFGAKIKYVGKNEKCLFFLIPGQKLIIYDAVAGLIKRQINFNIELDIINVIEGDKIYVLAENGIFYFSEANSPVPVITSGVEFKKYGRIHIADGKIVLLPWEVTKEMRITMIDSDNLSISEYKDYPPDFVISDEYDFHPYVRYSVKGDSIYYPPRCSNYFMVINRENGIKWLKADYSDEHFENCMIRNLISKKQVIYEINEKSLNRFIQQAERNVWNR